MTASRWAVPQHYTSEEELNKPPNKTLREMIVAEVIKRFCKEIQALTKDMYRNSYTPRYPRLRLAVSRKEYLAIEEVYMLMDGRFDGKIGHVPLIIEEPLRADTTAVFKWDEYVPDSFNIP